MGISIRTNAASLNASKSISVNSKDLALTSQQLSSGLRINSASDDPAGLAIASLMSSKIAGMMQAQNNIGQGVAMAQTVDGALSQQNSILQRLSTLAAQSANATLTDSQRVATVQPEVDALIAEFDKIGNSAAFNGISLLVGGTSGTTMTPASATSFVTGSSATTPVTFQSNYIAVGDTVTVGEASGIMTMTWTNAAGLQTQATANAAITTGITTSAQTINFLDASGATIGTASVAASTTAISRVTTSSDVSLTPAAGTSNVFVMQVGTEDNTYSQLTVTVRQSLSSSYSINALSMATQDFAQTAIATVSNAITTLGTARANIGGTISQLQQAEEFITNTLINTQVALGAITDIDVAAAAASLAEQNVLVQAATAMLAQANQSPTVVLSLLR